MKKADLEAKVEGQIALIQQQRETIMKLTEKINAEDPIEIVIKVYDSREDSIEEAFYIEGEFSPRDVKLLKSVFKNIEYRTAFPIEIFEKVKEV